MKKVGIFTFHRALNYGAVLQAYALQQTLLKLPVEAEIIDYWCPWIEKQYRSLLGTGTKKDRVKHLLKVAQSRIIGRKFSGFSERRLVLSKRYFRSRKDLTKIESMYDFFVVGSDQVWNSFLTDSDETYLLNFVSDNQKKVSYAASFGLSKLPEPWKSRCQVLLKSFSALSVRERQGADIIHDLTGREARVHIDPVMLLSAEEWKRIAAPIPDENYILVYLMGRSRTIIQFIKDLAKQTGCGVILFGSGLRRPVRAKYIRTGCPEEFLGYLAKARYVVTNSFHGTAFSILFHKDFFVEMLPEPSKANSRLEQILTLFGLSGRLIRSGICNDLQRKPDYDAVNKILKKEREKSIHYLKNALGLPI